MRCPRCGGNNFGWARKCDHCGLPLTEAPSPSPLKTIGESSDNEPLDLRKHALDQLPGKTVRINGVPYTILKCKRVIPHAHVFPLRHQQSNIVSFELKVFQCVPGSQEYEKIKQRRHTTFREKASCSTDRDPGATSFVIEEIYEQDGGLLGLQRTFNEDPGPQYHREQMAKAQALLLANRHAEALQEYDRVLSSNPHHTAALCNKGVAVARLGDIWAGVELFRRCMKIDINETPPHQNAASFLAHGGLPEPATQILDSALNRYPGDFATWMMLVAIATEWDTLELVDERVDDGMKLIAGSAVAERLAPGIAASRLRWERYCTALQRAIDLQLKKQWDAALVQLDEAAAISKRNALGELNRCICFFHKNDLETAFRRTLDCRVRLPNGHHLQAALILLLLASVETGKWDIARRIALDFGRRIVDPTALPRIPVFVKYSRKGSISDRMDCLEDLRIDRITSALSLLADRIPSDPSERQAITELRRSYERLAAM